MRGTQPAEMNAPNNKQIRDATSRCCCLTNGASWTRGGSTWLDLRLSYAVDGTVGDPPPFADDSRLGRAQSPGAGTPDKVADSTRALTSAQAAELLEANPAFVCDKLAEGLDEQTEGLQGLCLLIGGRKMLRLPVRLRKRFSLPGGVCSGNRRMEAALELLLRRPEACEAEFLFDIASELAGDLGGEG